MKKAAVIIYWAGVVLSLLSVGILMLFIIGEGLPPLNLQSAMFPFGVMLGLLIAIKYRLTGSLTALTCLSLFYLLEYKQAGCLPGGPWFFYFTSPSLLFIISKILNPKRMKEKK